MRSALHPFVGLLLAIVVALGTGRLSGQEDPGRARVGILEVTVYYATNGDPKAAGERAQEISADTRKRLERLEHLKFSHYRALGAEAQSIFKTYENWAQPLKPSDEILVRFEPRSQPTPEAAMLDLELWLSRKKILKTDVSLKVGQPLYVLGPQWRGGHLIIAVALAPE